MIGQPCDDGGWCDQLRSAIGADLEAIGARFVEKRRVDVGDPWGPEEVCFYAARGRLIALTSQPRDGQNCRIGAGDAQLDAYRQWPTLWHASGMDAHTDTDEGLSAYVRQFPQGWCEFIEFMGDRLRNFFASSRSAEAAPPTP